MPFELDPAVAADQLARGRSAGWPGAGTCCTAAAPSTIASAVMPGGGGVPERQGRSGRCGCARGSSPARRTGRGRRGLGVQGIIDLDQDGAVALDDEGIGRVEHGGNRTMGAGSPPGVILGLRRHDHRVSLECASPKSEPNVPHATGDGGLWRSGGGRWMFACSSGKPSRLPLLSRARGSDCHLARGTPHSPLDRFSRRCASQSANYTPHGGNLGTVGMCYN